MKLLNCWLWYVQVTFTLMSASCGAGPCQLSRRRHQRQRGELWRQQAWAQTLTPFTNFVTLIKSIYLSKPRLTSELVGSATGTHTCQRAWPRIGAPSSSVLGITPHLLKVLILRPPSLTICSVFLEPGSIKKGSKHL